MTPSGELTFGSVCSGIGSPEVAWHALGWRSIWMAEVDRAASEVLAFRFPGVPNLGDMTTLPARILTREIEAPDVLVGGTPCQSFSVAGLRKGLGDARGNLALVFIQLADAIDEVRREDGKEPCIVVFENVPGLLTSRDNAFGCFLAGIAGESDALEPAGRKWTNAGCVLGPERAVAWRTLDAQFFRLAQRRRRVFVVASARQGFDPAAVLLEFDGVRRDSPPSRETGEDITHSTAPCLTSSGRGVERTGDTRGQDPVVAVYRDAGVRQGDESPPRSGPVLAYGGNNQAGPINVATARNAHGGPHGRLDFESETFVVQPVCVTGDITHTLKADGFDASEDGTGRGQPIVNVYAFQPRIARNGRGDMGELVNALNAQSGETGKGDAAPCVAYAIQERAICENPLAGPDGVGVRDDDVAYTMEARTVPQAVAYSPICFSSKDYGADAAADIAPTLRAGGHTDSHANAGIPPAVAYRNSGNMGAWETGDRTDALTSANDMAAQFIIRTEMAVRRLMPEECEALQGFPRNWTLVPVRKITRTRFLEMQKDPEGVYRCVEIDGQPWQLAADGPRYKQLGNSMATNVMRFIGQRIHDHLTMRGHNGGPPLDEFDDILG